MRGLAVLTKLARREADERQGELGRASRATADAEAALLSHSQAIANELGLVANDPTAAAAAGAWVHHARRMRDTLEAQRAEAARQEDTARDALRSAFADFKRLDIANDEAERQSRVVATRRASLRAEEAYALVRAFAFE
jgi:hypothetical protein